MKYPLQWKKQWSYENGWYAAILASISNSWWTLHTFCVHVILWLLTLYLSVYIYLKRRKNHTFAAITKIKRMQTALVYDDAKTEQKKFEQKSAAVSPRQKRRSRLTKRCLLYEPLNFKCFSALMDCVPPPSLVGPHKKWSPKNQV